MDNSRPLGSQSDAHRIDGALKSKISASHTSETIHQCSRPSVSESMKRKASDSLSSRMRKSTRNLSWNGFQNTDMHELSDDDEDNREMQRTEVVPSGYSNRGHSPSQLRSSSHFCWSLENRAGNRQISPAVSTAPPKSHAEPNLQVNSNSQNQRSRELSMTNSKAKNEVKILPRIQQETFVRKLDPQSHFERRRSLIGNGCVSPLGKEFQPAKAQAKQQVGSMFSPIIIDDEEEVFKHHISHQTKTGIRISEKQKFCDSSIVQAQYPDPRIKGDLKNFKDDVADIKHQDAPAAFQQRFGNGKLTPALGVSETLTRGNLNGLNQNLYFSDHQRTNVTCGEPQRQIKLPSLKPGKNTPAGQAKEQSSYVAARSCLSDRADHEEDLDKVMLTKIANETIAAAPNLPSHVRLTRAQSMFAAQAERQRQKYGIRITESDQATKFSLPRIIDPTHRNNQTSYPCSHETIKIQDAESKLSSKVTASPALNGASGNIDFRGQIQDQINTLDNLSSKADILECAQHPQNLTGVNRELPLNLDTIPGHNLPPEESTPTSIKHQARSTQLGNITQSFDETKSASVQAGIETSKSVNRHKEAQLNMSLFVQDTEEPEYGSRVNITKIPSIIDPGQRNMETEVQRGMNTIKAMKQKVLALKKVKDAKDSEHATPAKAEQQEKVVLRDGTRDIDNTKKALTGNNSADALAGMERIAEELQGKGFQTPVEARNCRNRFIQDQKVNNDTPKYVNEMDSDGKSNKMGWIGLTEATTLLKKDITGSKSKGTGNLSKSYSQNKGGYEKASQESGVSHPSFQSMDSRTVSHKIRKDYSGIPLDLDKITNDDWFLMQLYKKGWGLKEIHSRWDELTGSTKTRESLRKRLGRLRTTFPDLFTNSETQLVSAENIRQRNENILQQLRDGKDDIVLFNTGEDGKNKSEPLETEVARAEKRKLALTVGLPENIGQGHVETGGKKISEDLQRYILDAVAREREDNSEYSYDEESTSVRTSSPVVDDDKVHFVYQVRRRTIKHHQSDDCCEWQYCADTYSTVEDANNAAIEEVKSNRGFDVWPITRWTAEISEDTGLIRHYGSGETGAVEVEVERHLRTYHEGIVPKSKIGWLKRQVFDIYEERTTCEETIDWEDENVEEIEQDPEPLPTKMLNERTSPINQPLDDTSEIERPITTKSCNRNLPDAGSTRTDEPQDVAIDLEQYSTPGLETTAETFDEDDYLFVEEAGSSPNWPRGDPGTSLETSSKAPVRTIEKTKVLRKVTHVLQRPIGGVCTVRDSANRLAGKTFRSLQKELDTNPDRRRRTYENCEAEKLADKEMTERLDKMEMDDESFDDIIVAETVQRVDGGSASSNVRVRARVWVVERTLENPRNL